MSIALFCEKQVSMTHDGATSVPRLWKTSDAGIWYTRLCSFAFQWLLSFEFFPSVLERLTETVMRDMPVKAIFSVSILYKTNVWRRRHCHAIHIYMKWLSVLSILFSHLSLCLFIPFHKIYVEYISTTSKYLSPNLACPVFNLNLFVALIARYIWVTNFNTFYTVHLPTI